MSDPKKKAGSSGRIADSKELTAARTNAAAGPVVMLAEAEDSNGNASATRKQGRSATVEGSTPLRESACTPATQGLTVPDELAVQAWNEQVRRRMRHQSRRSFLGLGAGLAAGLGAFAWLTSRREIDGLQWPFRKTLEVNEQFWRDYFSTRRISPEFSPSRVKGDRVNGDIGLDSDFDINKWKLEVHVLASQGTPLHLDLETIKKLPRVEMTTEFKCIEGWSVVVRWAGTRFTDFMKTYPPETISGDPFSLTRPEDLPPCVSLETPDGAYYVGLDIESMLHPETLLCYEMNGAPITNDHGAPLRLVVPVKYGVKNIKRIGTIRYSTLRPADYWAERGYDWYAGL